MIHYKSDEEIKIMAEGGKILRQTMEEVLNHIQPGVTEKELNDIAETYIRNKGAEPGFQKVKGYNYAICASTNSTVVHGIPTVYALQVGDIIGIDCGVYFKGFHTDMSETVKVTEKGKERKNTKDTIDTFLETGKKALDESIKKAKSGNHIGDISHTIQRIVEAKGYSVVRSLIGHGVGKQLHEDPEVPGFLTKPIQKTPQIKPGITMAIEVIYNMGKPDVTYANNDGWTIKTKDGSLSGVFERTVAITKNKTLILT